MIDNKREKKDTDVKRKRNTKWLLTETMFTHAEKQVGSYNVIQ